MGKVGVRACSALSSTRPLPHALSPLTRSRFPMSTLVTGATGLVGSALVQRLLEDGAAVRIFRRPTSRLDLLGAAAEAVEHFTGDLGEPRRLRDAMRGVRSVYHVAGRVEGGRGGAAALRRVNAQGTAHVVNAALEAGVERLVHTSSIAALGRPAREGALVDEATPWDEAAERSAYARSKRAAELEVRRGLAEGLEAVIVNPALVFGVGRAGENTRRLVDAVRRGRLPAVPPGSTCAVDVRDVAEGHLRAMHLGEPGERYLLGGENLSWRALVGTLARAFGAAPPRLTLSPRLVRWGAALAQGAAALTRTRPLLTREAARSAARRFRYDNRKAVRDLGCAFRPFAATAEHLAQALRREG